MRLRRNEPHAARLLSSDRQVVAANADLHRVSQRRMAQNVHGLAAGEAEFGQTLRNAVRTCDRVDTAVLLRGEVGECLHVRLRERSTFLWAEGIRSSAVLIVKFAGTNNTGRRETGGRSGFPVVIFVRDGERGAFPYGPVG